MPGLPELGPGYWVAMALLLGLLVGSFLNVVIHRVPIIEERSNRAFCTEMFGAGSAPSSGAHGAHVHVPPADQPYNLVVPRSACPSCGTPIAAWHNIPVLSWVLLRGRCARCGARISPRYPLVELLTGLLSAAVVYKFGLAWNTLGALVLTWYLIALAAIDIDRHLLPVTLTDPLLCAGLIASLGWSIHTTASLPASPWDAIAGAAGGYLSLWCVFHLFKLCTGKEGFGVGDFKLLAALGAWLGWRMLLPIVIGSAGLGTVVGLSLMVAKRHKKGEHLAYGPYLAAAGWLAMMWGQEWVSAYLGLYAPD